MAAFVVCPGPFLEETKRGPCYLAWLCMGRGGDPS